MAQTSALTTKSRLIDLHHHILPPVYLSEVRDLLVASWKLTAQQQSYLPARVLEWTPQNSLAEMDQNGVATSIVSIAGPGIWFGNVQAARTRAGRLLIHSYYCRPSCSQLESRAPGAKNRSRVARTARFLCPEV